MILFLFIGPNAALFGEAFTSDSRCIVNKTLKNFLKFKFCFYYRWVQYQRKPFDY